MGPATMPVIVPEDNDRNTRFGLKCDSRHSEKPADWTDDRPILAWRTEPTPAARNIGGVSWGVTT